ncbi:hypothetical protein [Sphingomonas sp. TDK1]|uniref:hypothetical protein n=1 Tax=Sphingomonas sp. TDK1 TaxID=453247 RepID=UPI0007DA059F|nr:hypothetical protein [Sphingomonas sp. TDK1]OAN64837.1 hypothetical protein A7X12_17525 [Sphingomonas sp. TDK1]
MLEQLKARGEAGGRARAERVARRLGEAVRERVPGVSVAVEGTRVTLSGRRLWRRWLADPALRWLGGLLR